MKKLVMTIWFTGTALLMADGAATFSKCAHCHGENGEKSALGKSAVIKGQKAAKTVKQLTAYKAGTLDQHGMGSLMKGQVASMDEAAMKSVANYIATMK
ncbi:Cytochrome C553 (soluble cytochrome f) [hydrothermal vent metagenome]|uniref:Cytochrome C553 (Soluble cytochrome f) n=1 Tax=hydrothermal vent metagenome TaxID=652676 RepID=A0A1W1CXA9_9ZZZZ